MSERPDDQSEDRPTPPQTLFKYLAPERVSDVLETGTFKFTELSNTNDIFEVRRTFNRIVGPKFDDMARGMKADLTSKKSIEKRLDESLKNYQGRKLTRKERRAAKAYARSHHVDQQFKQEFEAHYTMFTEGLNSEETADDFLETWGKDMLCFSLSESYGIGPMWTHYAGGHAGFVLQLNSSHRWFQSHDDSSKSRLHKVHYVDGMVDEVLDYPEAALGSKLTEWAYEREWRMYCGTNEIDVTIPTNPDPIRLKKFPANLVEAIIIGSKASETTTAELIKVAADRYPYARLYFANANKNTGKIELSEFAAAI